MRKVVVTSLLTIFFLISFNKVHAEEFQIPKQMTVQQEVDIRKGALSTYPRVKVLSEGQQVTIIGEFTNSVGEKWYRVDLGDILGWGKANNFSLKTKNLVGKVAKATEANVNVRRGATTAYQSIEKLKKDQAVKVIDKFQNNEGQLWYRIEVNDKKGWVLGVYLLETDTSVTSPSFQKVVQVQSIDVRKGATTSYPVVTTLKKNQKVKIIDTFKNKKGELWYRVNLGSLMGWVPESTFISNPQKTVQVDNATVHRGASTAYEIVDTIKINQKIDILDEFTNKNGELWYRVNLGNVIGWTPSSTFEPIEQKTVQVNNSPVRRGASTDYQIVANLIINQKVSIINDFINKTGETWYRVNLGNIIGWVHESAFVDVPKNTKTVQVSSTYVRRGASTEYASVAKITKNQKVNIIDTFTRENGELWYRIDLESILGWVPSSIFELETQKTVQINKPVVRRGASTEYEIVANLSIDQKVDVIDELINKNGETWYRVDLGNIIGWVHESTFTPVLHSIKAVQANTAFVRRGASIDYTSVAKVIKNQKVKIIDTFIHSDGEIWFRIDLGNIIGWVPQKTFQPQPDFKKGPVIIATKNAVIRAGASTSYRIVEEELPYNNKVEAIDEFINSTTAQRWIKIITPSGNTGWIQDYEIVRDTSEINYLYGLKKGILREGPNENANRIRTLRGSEKLILLDENNNWYLIEDPEGYRGWVLRDQTSQEIIKELLNPSLLNDDSGETLVWEKSMNYDLNYVTLSNNRLKIFGNISAASLPDFQIEGIKSIEYSKLDKAIIITFEPNYTFITRNNDNTVTVKAIPIGIKGKRIIIDAGHGGHDPGAAGPSRLREKDVNLSIAKLLKSELEKAGAIVLLTREDDSFLELSERTDIANNSNFDAFISIHCDSYRSTSRGTTTFYNNRVNFNGPKSIQLAQSVQKNLVNSIGTYNRQAKEQEFYVNRMNELPSILVEVAFISNPTEEALLKTPTFQQKAAKGIANGFKEYFNAF